MDTRRATPVSRQIPVIPASPLLPAPAPNCSSKPVHPHTSPVSSPFPYRPLLPRPPPPPPPSFSPFHPAQPSPCFHRGELSPLTPILILCPLAHSLMSTLFYKLCLSSALLLRSALSEVDVERQRHALLTLSLNSSTSDFMVVVYRWEPSHGKC